MDGEAKIWCLGRPALAEHHKLQLLQRRAGLLAAEALQRFQQQIRPLAGILRCSPWGRTTPAPGAVPDRRGPIRSGRSIGLGITVTGQAAQV